MSFHPTVSTFQPGSRTLPGEAFVSEQVFAEERRRIFARMWNCVGRASALPRAGDYVVRMVAGESIIIVRNRAGELRAYFNVCRHRGTRLCAETSGQLSETIQCPYHAWTYTVDEGQLIGAPHMQDTEDFDKHAYGLHRAHIAEWEGFVFINVAEHPEPFDSAFAIMMGRLARYGLGGLTVGHRVQYDVKANWKLVFENYSECLHCPMIHPELAVVLPYQSGANDLTEGPFLGGYMEIRAPNESATMSGRACGRIVSPAMLEGDHKQRAFYYTLMPNMLLSLHPDYVNYYILQPVAPDRTIVESEWMFHPETLTDARSNIQDAIEFWDVTNRQDWHIVAESQLGVSSARYTPGPYSPRESMPAAWDREYTRLMAR
jgi:glycine betaine catabolism A